MQVTVPDGVGPGMPFIVNTPSGSMQVTCPENATSGTTIVIDTPIVVSAIPMAVAAPVPMQMGASNLSQSDRMWLLEITPSIVGTWSMEGVPCGCPCVSLSGSKTIQPATAAAYPVSGTIDVMCCGCLPLYSGMSTGELSLDGTLETSKGPGSYHSTATATSVDIALKKVMYSQTGMSQQGPTSATIVRDFRSKTTEYVVIKEGRTTTFTLSKVT